MRNVPTLSVCMIARNEAEVVRTALRCANELADEIVLVDTGSDDGTDVIAREMGAVVHHVPWQDDFSHARNASLELATGDWILVLDADEWIEPSERARIREWIAGPTDRVGMMPQHTYVFDASTPGFFAGRPPSVWPLDAPGYVVARQTRLFPRDPRVRYQGRVHEQVQASTQAAGLCDVDVDVVVHHVGKIRDAALMARKQRLYRTLGEWKLDEQRDARSLFELGVQCMELGEDERAIELLRAALGASPMLGDRAKIVACLAGVLAQNDGVDAADALVREHLVDLSAYTIVWERWGSVLGQAGRHLRAAEVLERASILFDDAAGLLRLLGETYLALGQYDRALGAYRRLRALAPDTDLGRAGAAVARAGAGDARALRALFERSGTVVAASARAGARRWLGESAWLSAWPRVGHTDEDLATLLRELRTRRRASTNVGGVPVADVISLEALWRSSRTRSDLQPGVRSRLRAAVGLPDLGAVPTTRGEESAPAPGQKVQVRAVIGR